MKDVMLDLETLGNRENKVICQIGAVYFDNVTGELGKEFKYNVDARTHIAAGGVIDADTVYWWLAQSDEARASILADPKVDITFAMRRLEEFLMNAKRVWSHATFDFTTIMETYRMLGIKPPISYKAGMDLRTLVYLAGTTFDRHSREGVHHDALDDAKFQVKYAVAALNAIKTHKQAIKLLEKLGDK